MKKDNRLSAIRNPSRGLAADPTGIQGPIGKYIITGQSGTRNGQIADNTPSGLIDVHLHL